MEKIEGKGKLAGFINKYHLQLYTTNDFTEAMRSVKSIKNYPEVSADIETTGFNFWEHDMIGLGIAFTEDKALYISTRTFSDTQITRLIQAYNKATEGRRSYFWNFYFDKSFTKGRYGVGLNCTDDGLIYGHTMFNHRKLKGKGLKLKDFTRDFLPFGDYEEELNLEKRRIIKEKKILTEEFNYGMFDDSILAPYGCFDVICTQILTKNLIRTAERKSVSEWTKLKDLLDLKHKVTEEYIRAKLRGMKVDRDMVLELGAEWGKKLKPLYAKLNELPEIKRLVKEQGKEFNPRSSKQKAKLFFDICGFPIIETTDKGSPSTGAFTIETILRPYEGVAYEDLPGRVKVISVVDEIKLYEKGINSFLGVGSGKGKNGLWTLTSNKYPYVHSNHNITGTITGRTATSKPNLAQMPSARSILGKIKKCFIPHKDYKFISFDYSSAELRIIAYYSQEPNFMDAFKQNLNLHSWMALKIFGDKMDIPENLTLKEKVAMVKHKYANTWRAKVKAVNFSLSYGTTAYGIAKNLDMTLQEAEEFLDTYNKANNKLMKFIEDNKAFAKYNGYVEDLLGQRLELDEMKKFDLRKNAKNTWSVSKQSRKTTNFKIQASSASLLYRSIVSFFEEVRERDLDIHMVATIYDSVKLEVHKDIPDELVFDLLKKHFEIKIGNVDLLIDLEKADTGDSWHEVAEI